MNNIEKLERALAMAKDLNFTDKQVEELIALIFSLPITRITWQQPVTLPYVPYIGDGGMTTPLPGTTVICTNENPGKL